VSCYIGILPLEPYPQPKNDSLRQNYYEHKSLHCRFAMKLMTIKRQASWRPKHRLQHWVHCDHLLS
jgi:hypothetical protein